MEAVDGFEPKQEANDPLWRIYNTSAISDSHLATKKVTPLFKE
jgi:hypothetical protein